MSSKFFINNPDLHYPEFDGGEFLLQGTSTTVILFHGFTATTLEVKQLGETIHLQTGFSVHAPLLPGHGTSPQDLARCKFHDWIISAESIYFSAIQKTKRVIVCGESMGGLLALYLAATHGEIDRFVVFAPALKIPGAWKANLFKHFFFGSPKKNLSPVKDGYLPWQGYKINPLRAISELLKIQKLVCKILPNINQPGLIFQGLRDETIDPAGSQIIFNAIQSNNKDLIYLPNCGHAILLDREYPITYEKTVRFIL